ncbi:MAG: tRNA dihydrouridine synthase DusB [Candidatus Nanoarchaeia archaeon]
MEKKKKFPELKSRLVLAPMHEITNIAFRIMCKKYGAGLVYTPLLSANAIAIKNKKTLELAITNNKEKPCAIQLFSENIGNLANAAKLVEKDFDVIDINLGCPSEKIMKQGSGGALLENKEKIKEIIEKINKEIKKPLTVKIRAGFNDSKNAFLIAKICESAGASAIAIHARTVKQGYSGKADWEIIKNIKENVKIPVIGNGDVVNGKTAKKMLDETKCDYVMIGRAAIGNPFIFKEINHYLKTGKEIKQTKKEKTLDYFEYIRLTEKYKIFSLKDAKQKACQFTKGLEGSARLRAKLSTIKDYKEIKKLLNEF